MATKNNSNERMTVVDHRNGPRPLSCEYCEYSTGLIPELQAHVQDEHDEFIPNYRCRDCGSLFHSPFSEDRCNDCAPTVGEKLSGNHGYDWQVVSLILIEMAHERLQNPLRSNDIRHMNLRSRIVEETGYADRVAGGAIVDFANSDDAKWITSQSNDCVHIEKEFLPDNTHANENL